VGLDALGLGGADEAIRFMEESRREDKPFFLWWNSTRMHIWTRLKAC
jgi:arylsulfatase